MVQQMIDKFSEYRLVNSGAAIPSGDKQESVSLKKVALRDSNNETRNIIPKPTGSSPLSKDRGCVADTLKVSGIKRNRHDCPWSPIHHQSIFNNGTNGHLVYARRKLETEPSKINACGDADISDFTNSSKFNNDEKKESNSHGTMLDPRVSCFPAFAPIPEASQPVSSGRPFFHPPGKPIVGLAIAEPIYLTTTTGIPIQVDYQEKGNLHWKERFLQLQKFLKNYNQSSQEEYIQMLQSLSAVGRSKHAIELEKRAIHLLLEEGKELHRMKVLNVFGKASPSTSVPMQTLSPLQTVMNQNVFSSSSLLSNPATSPAHQLKSVLGKHPLVAKSQIGASTQSTGKWAHLEQEIFDVKEKMKEMKKLIGTLMNTEGDTSTLMASTQNYRPQGVKCKLFRMVKEDIVAEGWWVTDDPTTVVHHVPLGPGASKVWVDHAMEPKARLWRTTNGMEIMKDAIGSTIAWPTDQIIKA